MFFQTMTTKKALLFFDQEYYSEDNNHNDNVEARDENDRSITNNTAALFKSKSGGESWELELLLYFTSKTSQRNVIRRNSREKRYAMRMGRSLGDCFRLFFRDNLLE